VAKQHATAQTATVINLSCDGKLKIVEGGGDLASKMGLVVNLAQRTVVGFGPVAQMLAVDDLNVSFSNIGESGIENSPSIYGNIDRVTGAAWANVGHAARDGKIIWIRYDLVCTVTNRLF
jgi:hypothetical protein